MELGLESKTKLSVAKIVMTEYQIVQNVELFKVNRKGKILELYMFVRVI
jgi:hypothetical protein